MFSATFKLLVILCINQSGQAFKRVWLLKLFKSCEIEDGSKKITATMLMSINFNDDNGGTVIVKINIIACSHF